MIPKTVHQMTTTKAWEEMRLTAKAKRMMPDFEFRLWDNEKNLALVEKHFPQHAATWRSFPYPVIGIDVVRCLYLYEFGGIYCDTDYRFYKPLDEAFLAHRCVLGIEEPENAACGGGIKLGNAFMASEQGFAMWPAFVEDIFRRYAEGERRIEFIGGPHALTLYLQRTPEFRDQVTMLPQIAVYPAFTRMKLSTERDRSTIGAHLCWGSWRKKGLLQSAKNRTRRLITAL